MSNINVSYAEIQSTAKNLEVGRDSIYSELDKLKSMVDSLVTSGFATDKASGSFQTFYQEFTTGAKHTIEGLDGIVSYLNRTIQVMQDTDSQLATSIG
jgi:WXG100 family type VII secretion target